ncbi:coproporphyrinogen III oxidase [Clostridium sp. 19966]|uniref:coproporphyrinogen III oxidase n=1 Tax=Clostridium sp. 19966 TaxID=2768166 RepID=UPI0028DE83BE|nr:coproporphyrinogen III oxidase [Clostridium sp. 19966]MDT8716247.1 coproporphyrinogen III oxidase [Clostridium sp. 19966]
MSILIKLNDLKYRYDVFQITNIFYQNTEIDFVDKNEDIDISISDGEITITSHGTNRNYSIDESLPFKENVKMALYKYFVAITKVEHPWGTLIGIRPAKIAGSLMKKGLKDEEIIQYYDKHYVASREKTELCIEVARYEKDLINKNKNNISIYIGMPFCPTRCAYCSFASNSIKGKEQLVGEYLKALSYEINSIKAYIESKQLNIENIYFGGGTPTSVTEKDFEGIMECIYDAFIKEKNIKEFTVEAGRPDSITLSKLLSMKKYRVTRISINPQTMNDKTLKRIGRLHTVKDVIDKFNLARKCGFDNINMDIILGLPGENLEDVINTCKKIKELSPESLTVHGMAVKRASKIHEELLNNKFDNKLDLNDIIDMYDVTRKTSQEINMHPYYMYRQKNMIGNMENIGYCKEGFENIYNIQIMEEKQTIIALGADAVTKVIFMEENRLERFANLKDVKEYVNRVEEIVQKKISLLNTLYKD